MKINSKLFLTVASISIIGCSNEPSGRWEATQKIDILFQKGDPQTVAFNLEVGTVCALSNKWYFEKELRYKEVVCPNGRGWITTDKVFKNLSD